MNSIPHKLEIDIKNILKFNFIEISKRKFGKVIDENLDFFNMTKYINTTLFLIDGFKEVIVETLQISFPIIDELFLNSQYRKLNYFKAQSHPRTIVTVFGEISYNRIIIQIRIKLMVFSLLMKSLE